MFAGWPGPRPETEYEWHFKTTSLGKMKNQAIAPGLGWGLDLVFDLLVVAPYQSYRPVSHMMHHIHAPTHAVVMIIWMGSTSGKKYDDGLAPPRLEPCVQSESTRTIEIPLKAGGFRI